ncbi:sulfite exporter TauE/SafE family protein [Siminovitchia sediminis]|uniref:Probable membrane transporter protein n=1 Tax=Siminovitchia sediminis TaxID=1274353 RepID=A0ABW4KMI6_9BACI
MDVGLFTVIFLIGFIGSLISGMLGIGGSIIKYPMLLYIPSMFGLSAFTAHEVSGISAVQVLFSTIGGVWAYRKGGFLNRDLILYMGISILAGSFVGAFGSRFLPAEGINLVYAMLATIAAVLMFLPKKGKEDLPFDQVVFSKPLASVLAFIIGTSAGIVGAAGAFILVPIMLVVLKIPTRVTIASSLAITFISSIGSTVGKIATGQVLLVPAFIMVIASILGAPAGANIGKKMRVTWLQLLLAILILGTAIKIWLDVLNL